MNKTAGAVRSSGDSKNFKFLNVIMHGAFGYVFDDDAIRVYSPACFGHFYAAGGLHSLQNICQNVDYRLIGVKAPNPSKRTISPGGTADPVLSLSKVGIDRKDIDSFNVRYTMLELPYPLERTERPSLIYTALNELVGEIYTGDSNATTGLNGLDMLPSMHLLTYELLEGEDCGLLPLNAPKPDCGMIPANQPSPTDPDVSINFHIFCSKAPMADMSGMTDDGHIRRAFAAVVGMLGGLELSLNFPNRFQPALPSNPPPLPVGVSQSDLEPGDVAFLAKDGGPLKPMFGHVNCQYTDLLVIP